MAPQAGSPASVKGNGQPGQSQGGGAGTKAPGPRVSPGAAAAGAAGAAAGTTAAPTPPPESRETSLFKMQWDEKDLAKNGANFSKLDKALQRKIFLELDGNKQKVLLENTTGDTKKLLLELGAENFSRAGVIKAPAREAMWGQFDQAQKDKLLPGLSTEDIRALKVDPMAVLNAESKKTTEEREKAEAKVRDAKAEKAALRPTMKPIDFAYDQTFYTNKMFHNPEFPTAYAPLPTRDQAHAVKMLERFYTGEISLADLKERSTKGAYRVTQEPATSQYPNKEPSKWEQLHAQIVAKLTATGFDASKYEIDMEKTKVRLTADHGPRLQEQNQFRARRGTAPCFHPREWAVLKTEEVA